MTYFTPALLIQFPQSPHKLTGDCLHFTPHTEGIQQHLQEVQVSTQDNSTRYYVAYDENSIMALYKTNVRISERHTNTHTL